jgi:CBS domain-containing membrane protein
MLDTVALVLLAVPYNRLTGRRYPFRQPASSGVHRTADPRPEQRGGLAPEDLAALLERFNQSANIGAEDLGRVLAAAEQIAAARRYGGLTCRDVMSRDLVTVAPDTRLSVVADLLRRHRFRSLPVVSAEGDLLGIISQGDLIERARAEASDHREPFAAALSHLLGAVERRSTQAASIMTKAPRAVAPDTPVGELIGLLADGGVEVAPVVEEGRLRGVITRSDLLAVLARYAVAPTDLSVAA